MAFTKRKDGMYVTTKVIDGKRKYIYARTEKKLKDKLIKLDCDQNDGPMFSDVAEEWWEVHQKKLSPNSLRGYVPAFKRAIDHFGDQRIKTITPSAVDGYINSFAVTHAAKTTATQLNIINQIFRYARMNMIIDRLPTDVVQVPRGLKRTPRLLPPDADVQAVKNNLDYPVMGLYAYFLLYSGLRRGEALALQYRDIDRVKKIINVEKSLCAYRNDPIIKTTKTEAGKRVVPLVNALLDVLPSGKPNDYIFTRDGHLFSDADFDTLWGQYQRHTGITSTPHQLRHWFATLLYDAGVDKFEAARYMGHTTAQMTEIYTHITNSRTTNTLDKLNQTIGTL